MIGTQLQSFNGKRSLPDSNEDDILNYKWIRILQILDRMEEKFRYVANEDCRKRLVCDLSANRTLQLGYDKNAAKYIEELSSKLRYDIFIDLLYNV